MRVCVTLLTGYRWLQSLNNALLTLCSSSPEPPGAAVSLLCISPSLFARLPLSLRNDSFSLAEQELWAISGTCHRMKVSRWTVSFHFSFVLSTRDTKPQLQVTQTRSPGWFEHIVHDAGFANSAERKTARIFACFTRVERYKEDPLFYIYIWMRASVWKHIFGIIAIGHAGKENELMREKCLVSFLINL